MDNKLFEKIGGKQTLIVLTVAVLYLLWAIFFIGLRNDHLILIALCLTAYFASSVSRKVLLSLVFFFFYWVMYDSTRIYPNYLFNPVHIKDIYHLEKAWFGIQTAGGLLSPNEFLKLHAHPVLDVLSGLFYLCWVPVPMAFAVWLFFKDKKLLLEFSFAFFLVNFFGIMLYYLYPAAPPWYVDLHGFTENFDIPGNEAGLANFDRILGIHLFHGMYAKNANVFAAVPSLHAAYPVITFYFALKKRLKWGSVFFGMLCLGIWFSAVYSRHHYILDVLLGISCSITTLLVFEFLNRKTILKNLLERYSKVIQ